VLATVQQPRASARSITAIAAFGGILAALACMQMFPYLAPIGGLLGGIVPGVVVGAIERSERRAALVAAFASVPLSLGGAFLGIPVAAGVAWGVRRLVDRGGRVWRDRICLAALAFVLVAGLGVGVYRAYQPAGAFDNRSVAEWISAKPDLSAQFSDSELLLRVYQIEKAGTPYYDALFQALSEWHPERPTDRRGAVNFRLPFLYWLWTAVPLPALPTLVGGLLALGALGAALAYAFGRTISHPGLALASSSAVMAYLAFLASSTRVTLSEPWAGAFVLIALAAWGLHRARERDNAWLAVSVLAALAASQVREIAVFVLVAGLVAALLERREGRRWTWAPWAFALAVFVGVYWLHVRAIGGGLFSPNRAAGGWFGGNLFVRTIITWSDGAFYLVPIELAVLLTLLAIVSAFFLRDLPLRVFALLGVALPMFAFGFMGTSKVDMTPIGWWGAILMPSTLALLCAAYLLLSPRQRRMDKAEVGR
jgi:hypothetical protein